MRRCHNDDFVQGSLVHRCKGEAREDHPARLVDVRCTMRRKRGDASHRTLHLGNECVPQPWRNGTVAFGCFKELVSCGGQKRNGSHTWRWRAWSKTVAAGTVSLPPAQ